MLSEGAIIKLACIVAPFKVVFVVLSSRWRRNREPEACAKLVVAEASAKISGTAHDGKRIINSTRLFSLLPVDYLQLVTKSMTVEYAKKSDCSKALCCLSATGTCERVEIANFVIGGSPNAFGVRLNDVFHTYT